MESMNCAQPTGERVQAGDEGDGGIVVAATGHYNSAKVLGTLPARGTDPGQPVPAGGVPLQAGDRAGEMGVGEQVELGRILLEVGQDFGISRKHRHTLVVRR